MNRQSAHARIDPYQLAELLGRPAPTSQQAALISAEMEPTLVVAGAGSGKTETIAQRVVYLIANGLVAPGEVLGLTFTRKAAAELATRIRSRLRILAAAGAGDAPISPQLDESQPLVSTYHAFAGQIIAEFGPLIGVEPAVAVLTATSSWQLVHRLVTRWDGDLETDRSPDQVTDDVLALSSALADHLVTPEELGSELDRVTASLTSAPPSPRQSKPLHSKLADIVRQLKDRRSVIPLVAAYTAEKRRRRVVDFADQMQLAADLVERVPEVARIFRQRFPVVMLDEYQDTGHAQRVILRGLFGDDDRLGDEARSSAIGHAVTAVGDPVQSIYAWRGASASNLPRFVSDFPRAGGRPAAHRELLVSFRNAKRILEVANAISAPVRSAPVVVGELLPSGNADDGVVRTALLDTVDAEVEWLADALHAAYLAQSLRDGPPTTAVLVRRRADMARIAAALRARDLPVEVVGVGGLIHEPEVADVIAMLRLVVDHQSGPSAVRILTGARWRLGIADIAVLMRRARELGAPTSARSTRRPGGPAAEEPLVAIRAGLADAMSDDELADTGLVDALADPGDGHDYSAEGWRRLSALRVELQRLRSQLRSPLHELISDIERTLRLDIEVRAAGIGRAHLDAFADVVSALEDDGAGPIELLDYLSAAERREDGLDHQEPTVSAGAIQILTVHAAKGLEWDVVAVPHLSAGTFPSDQKSTWLGDATQIPPTLRGDRADIPALQLPTGVDQSALGDYLSEHKGRWADQHQIEERRLFYVAVTRARHRLLLSAHYWTSTRKSPSGPGALFEELVDIPAGGDADDDGAPAAGRDNVPHLLGCPEICVPAPLAHASNPLLEQPVTAEWPVDPLGQRRGALERAAAEVTGAIDTWHAESADQPSSVVSAVGVQSPDPFESVPDGTLDPGDDPEGWRRDAAVLLAERAARARVRATIDVVLPASLSVTNLVDISADPQALARRLHRPVPSAPALQARRGTAFHAWIESYFAGEPLLDLGDLPGAHDPGGEVDVDLQQLIDRFRASVWAARTPVAVEVPFVTQIGGLPVRGRIDAVFREPDGSWLVIDWKTGAIPGPDRAAAVATQIAAYRVAWSKLARRPVSEVRGAFYYVAHDRLVAPDISADSAWLEGIIAGVDGGDHAEERRTQRGWS